jgi:hypothetical protein
VNSARAEWHGYGRQLAAAQPERVRLCQAQGLPVPTPRQVRAAFMAGTSAGANARRWLAEGWRQHDATA